MYFELGDYMKNLGVVWFSGFAGNPITASTSYITFCLFNVQRNLQPVRLVVNDRKFLIRTVFFTYIKPASSNNSR